MQDTQRWSTVGRRVKRSFYLLDEKQTTIVRHKHPPYSEELIPPPPVQEGHRKQAGESQTFIFHWREVELVSRVSRGRRRGRAKESWTGRRREKRKANAIKTGRVNAIERGAREVNLEQISIVTEREGWMFLRADRRGFTQQGWSWGVRRGERGSQQRDAETESSGRAETCTMIQSVSN